MTVKFLVCRTSTYSPFDHGASMPERGASAKRKPMKALTTLRRHYEDRLLAARAAHAKGQRIVGTVGPGAPSELLFATGHMPVAIAPLPNRPTPLAERYVTETFEPLARPVFDQLISEELSFLELAVVISRAERDALIYH